MSRLIIAAVAFCACGELGVTLDISAEADVPALDTVRVQVTQGDLLVERHFTLDGLPLPQTVAVTSKGLTRGDVSIGVQGLRAGTVEAVGTVTASLRPASGSPHASVVLERSHCTPLECATPPGACGRLDDGCGGQHDCGGCDGGEACVDNRCGCAPLIACPPGKECGLVSDGCGGALDCGGCDAGFTCGVDGGSPNLCRCVPLELCPPGACGDWDDGCGGTLHCANDCAPGCSLPYYCVMDPLAPVVEGPCTADDQCPAGQTCSSGTCADAGPPCVLHHDCPIGMCNYGGARQTGICR